MSTNIGNKSLRNITTDELTKILKDHELWLETVGDEGRRANLIGADLSNANLRCANLRCAKLWWADFRGANFANADLSRAILRYADLWGADLSGADLWGANLRGANLSGADLWGANLRYADLWGADLSGAKLRGADLFGANLANADLNNVQNLPDFQHCPKNGMFIAFKKVLLDNTFTAVLELEIPADARRVSSTGTKCRADKAKVLKAMNLDGTTIENPGVLSSMWGKSNGLRFIYEVGKEVNVVDSFSDDVRVECAPGIHFFLTFEEAKNYQF